MKWTCALLVYYSDLCVALYMKRICGYPDLDEMIAYLQIQFLQLIIYRHVHVVPDKL